MSELHRVALDSRENPKDRLSAIKHLATSRSVEARDVLIAIGERTTEPPEILKAVGHSLAEIGHNGVALSELDMSNLAEVAYEAFCEWSP